MSYSHLPKTLRNSLFVLGMVMISMAGAMEQVEEWNESANSVDPAQCHAAHNSIEIDIEIESV